MTVFHVHGSLKRGVHVFRMLVLEAHRRVYHSPLGSRAIKKKKRDHPEGDPGANLKSISHRCHPILAASGWELTKETSNLPLSCLQGGSIVPSPFMTEELAREAVEGIVAPDY